MSDKQTPPLRETDIRPDHLISGQRQRYLADVVRLLSHRDKFVMVNGQYDISNQPFLQQVLIDEWERVGDAFQTFLANHLLSSHMWLVGHQKERQ